MTYGLLNCTILPEVWQPSQASYKNNQYIILINHLDQVHPWLIRSHLYHFDPFPWLDQQAHLFTFGPIRVPWFCKLLFWSQRITDVAFWRLDVNPIADSIIHDILSRVQSVKTPTNTVTVSRWVESQAWKNRHSHIPPITDPFRSLISSTGLNWEPSDKAWTTNVYLLLTTALVELVSLNIILNSTSLTLVISLINSGT